MLLTRKVNWMQLRKITENKFYEQLPKKDINVVREFIYDILKLLKNLPKAHNNFQNKNHELNFLEGLTELGFQNLETISGLDIYREDMDVLGNIHFMPHLSDRLIVIHEPYGSQAAPDFILVVYGFIIYIEFKSSKTNKIMWNSAYSQKDWIYLYSNTDKNITMFFIGDNIIGPNEVKIIEDYILDYKSLSQKYNLKLNKINSKWTTYPRLMFDNSGTIIESFEASVYALVNERVSYVESKDYAIYTKHSN